MLILTECCDLSWEEKEQERSERGTREEKERESDDQEERICIWKTSFIEEQFMFGI